MDHRIWTSTVSKLECVPALLRDPNAWHGAAERLQPSQKWLVPVDGTPAAMAAIDYVIANADNAATLVHLVNVQPPIMSGDVSAIATAGLVGDLRRSQGERALRDAQAALSRHAFRHTSEVVFGTPAESIVGCAEARGCSKIVMGARRSGLLTRLVQRSVSGRVVRFSHVPVTIVKPPAVRASTEREFWSI